MPVHFSIYAQKLNAFTNIMHFLVKIATLYFYKVVAPCWKTPRNLTTPSFSKKEVPQSPRKFLPTAKIYFALSNWTLFGLYKNWYNSWFFNVFVGPFSDKASNSTPRVLRDPTSNLIFWLYSNGVITLICSTFYTSLYKSLSFLCFFSAWEANLWFTPV